MEGSHSLSDPKRVVADGYDRMGEAFSAWNSERSPAARRWFLREVLARLGDGSVVLELGCGPGTDAEELSAGRRYIGIDLSSEQLSIARRHVPDATFVVGDLTTIGFRPASFDGVVAFYVFNHVPKDEVRPSFQPGSSRGSDPGGWLMSSLLTTEAEDRVEEWLDVPMFFGAQILGHTNHGCTRRASNSNSPTSARKSIPGTGGRTACGSSR